VTGAILIWIALVNLWTAFRFAQDKRAAVDGRRRVPERTLLQLATLGGTPAALAARHWLRHKTRKEPFSTRLKVIAAAQAATIAAAVALGW